MTDKTKETSKETTFGDSKKAEGNAAHPTPASDQKAGAVKGNVQKNDAGTGERPAGR